MVNEIEECDVIHELPDLSRGPGVLRLDAAFRSGCAGSIRSPSDVRNSKRCLATALQTLSHRTKH
jgi:hypothetical protein